MHATANLSKKQNIRGYQSIVKVLLKWCPESRHGELDHVLIPDTSAEVDIIRDCFVFHLQ